jgi:hypothetical protein
VALEARWEMVKEYSLNHRLRVSLSRCTSRQEKNVSGVDSEKAHSYQYLVEALPRIEQKAFNLKRKDSANLNGERGLETRAGSQRNIVV